MVADEKSDGTRGVCAKRSRCLEVDCDGAVAHCSVTLISKVDSCGLLVGVEARSELKKQLAAAARAAHWALLSQKRIKRQTMLGWMPGR